MVSETIDRYLKTGVALSYAMKIAAPRLMMLDFVNPIPEKSAAFLARQDLVGKGADTKKEEPPLYLIGADMPELDRSRPTITGAMISARGFKLRLSRSLLREENTGPLELVEAYETAGYWLSELCNKIIYTEATTSGNYGATSKFNPAATWDNEEAAPIDDLYKLSEDFDREGYPFRLSDMFIGKDEFYELVNYLRRIDVSDEKQRNMYGVYDLSKDVVNIPMVGRVHKMMSGATAGSILGLDANLKGIEYHYYNDNKFTVPEITYKTIENGNEVSKRVQNLGFHFKQYVDEDKDDTILKFWMENKCVVRKPYAVIYGTGI